jgi:hypothetical protein
MNSTGVFSANVTGLSINIIVYFRAKAVGDGTSYGIEKSFYTPVYAVPAVDAYDVSNITSNSATLNGWFGTPVTANGSSGPEIAANVSFQWGVSSRNYIYETTPESINISGIFIANLTGLSANTTYYFRAKAVGEWMGGWMSLGNEWSFTTLPAVIPGDANMDGKVDSLDVTKVERIIVGWDTPTPGADANQDGKINALDITKVERIIARLD